MSKKILSILLMVIMVVSLAACGQEAPAAPEQSSQSVPTQSAAPASETPEPEDDKLVVGFAQIGQESGWRDAETWSILNAAEELGVDLKFSDGQQKQENQIKAIRSFIAYQVDVIAFAPIVKTGWDNVLSEAKAAGIPVILTDRTIDTDDESLYTCYIGSDFITEGLMAGDFLKKKFSESNETINIAELLGTVGAAPALGRSEGFREAIKDDPRFHIICSQSGDFMRSKGKEAMTGILKYYDDIDVLYSHNDSMTLGAIEAMEEAGISPGEDIVIITIDGEQEAVDALKAGEINCIVECDPMLGPTIMDTAKKIKEGEQVPRNIYSKDNIYTEWDDLNEIPPRGY